MKDTKIRIWNVGNIVSYQITESSDISKILNKGDLFKSSSGYLIRSYGEVGISEYSISLPSIKSQINVVGNGIFSSSDKAKLVCESIKNSLIEWKGNGFKLMDDDNKKFYSPFQEYSNYNGYGNIGYGNMVHYMESRVHEFESRNPNYTERELESFMGDVEDEYMIMMSRMGGNMRVNMRGMRGRMRGHMGVWE